MLWVRKSSFPAKVRIRDMVLREERGDRRFVGEIFYREDTRQGRQALGQGRTADRVHFK